MLQNRAILFPLLLLMDAALLFFYVGELSISGHEAWMLYEGDDFVSSFSRFFLDYFGWNDYALRVPFITIHLLNTSLIYLLSKEFLKKEGDALIATLLYLLLPGVTTSAMLLSKAGIVTLFTLLFVYLSSKKSRIANYLLVFLAFLDNSFSILFLALFFYALYTKENRTIVFSLILFAINMYIFGFDDGGDKPKGHFLDTIGAYAAIFSPLLFIYLIYSLYRSLIKEEKNLLWFIAFTAFALSILLSFRQRLQVEDFAPFLVIATPLLLKTFLNGLRVRLPQFRKKYKVISFFALSTLVFTFLSAFINKPFYHFYTEPENHFAYRYQVAKELSEKLKKLGLSGVTSDNSELLYRLRFYGVPSGDEFFITKKEQKHALKVSIFYTSQKIATFYVTKIHKN